MAPLNTTFRATCALRFTPRPRAARLPIAHLVRVRNASEKNNPAKLPQAQPGEAGPNTQQAEHVSEEAAKMAKIQGGQGPDLDQGTPVQEILKEEREQAEHAPQIVKDEAHKANPSPQTASHKVPDGTRAFSTSTRRAQLDLHSAISTPPFNPAFLSTTTTIPSSTTTTTTQKQPTHKFPLPSLATIPTKPNTRPTTRQHQRTRETLPLIPQLTNLLMRDGKKSVAERNISLILSTLRTSPAPTLTTTRPLLPGHPPASYLPLDPVAYLTLAIDSVAPLMRIRSQRGAAGGGVALQIPVPLGLRQRRRTAFMWILDAVGKKPNRGSGREMFAQRVAGEMVAVVEGRSGVWEKRQAVHRLATAGRMNVGWKGRGRR